MEPIKIQNVYMIANGRAVLYSRPIRRSKTSCPQRKSDSKLVSIKISVHQYINTITHEYKLSVGNNIGPELKFTVKNENSKSQSCNIH